MSNIDKNAQKEIPDFPLVSLFESFLLSASRFFPRRDGKE